ncbi:MAG TPA: glycosyltransferase family 2 protein [Thermomicrobiales bacterium]|jgi:glycosyltransferase involved in cell wall biosynthesis
MIADRTLSLILPAHNEEENLEIVVRAALAALPESFVDYEIVIVNDGSRDGTAAVADRLAEEDHHVRVVHHAQNRGYGAALQSGFGAGRGELLMFMDADRQFDPRDIARLAPHVQGYDIVAGYRIARNDPAHRKFIGSSFNLVVRILFGIKVTDIDCGFKIFQADLLRDMELQSPGALINTEIHAKANRRGASLIEVGVNHYPRVSGQQSGGSIPVMARALRELVLLRWRLRSYAPPARHAVAPGSVPALTELRSVSAQPGAADK